MASVLQKKDSDLSDPDGVAGLTDARNAVLAVLRASGAPMGPTAVHAELTTGSSKGSVKNLLAALVRDGYAKKAGKNGRAYQYVTDHPHIGHQSPTNSADPDPDSAEQRASFIGEPPRAGYTDIEEWSKRKGIPNPDAPTGPVEPLAPDGVVLVFVVTDDDGKPVYGFDHTGKVHQLGRAIQLRAKTPTSSASAAGPTS